MTPERLKELKAWAGAIASDAPDEAQAWRETLDALETEMAERAVASRLADQYAARARRLYEALIGLDCSIAKYVTKDVTYQPGGYLPTQSPFEAALAAARAVLREAK